MAYNFKDNKELWKTFGDLLGSFNLAEENSRNIQVGQIVRRTYTARYHEEYDEILVDISAYRAIDINYDTMTFSLEYDESEQRQECYKSPEKFMDKYRLRLYTLASQYDQSLIGYVDDPDLNFQDNVMIVTFWVGGSLYVIQHDRASREFSVEVTIPGEDGDDSEHRVYDFDDLGLVGEDGEAL